MTAPEPATAGDIEAARAAHARLTATVAALSDSDVATPCLLPGWTRAHLISHLARNADSHTWVLEGARIGEVRDQYPRPGMREADIEAGAGRDAAALLDDLRSASARLEAAWAAMPDDAWARECRMSAGVLPAEELPFRRLREVEVHHVDLGLGYSPAEWPAAYVDGELARSLPRLQARADGAPLAAWLLGRGPAPDLTSWQ